MRVVVADDSVLLREGVVRLLEESGFEVVAQAGDDEDLIRKVGAHKPDVAVVDIRMPPTNTEDGLRAALEIRATHPETGVLVLSQYVEEGYALELVSDSAGGVGYLMKDRVADVERFVESVKRVATGWESQFTIAVDTVISCATVMELAQTFVELAPSTRLRRREVDLLVRQVLWR